MIYDHSVKDGKQQTVPMETYRGQVLLIVNVASQCGFTPQYDGLQTLRDQFHQRGFEVLGFPCNQFGKQEPGTADEIQQFCETKFHIKFPIMDKVEVNGEHAIGLFQDLKTAAPGILGSEAIKWNFTKFLVSRDGQTIKRFAPKTKPEELVKEIEAMLDQS